MHFDPRPVLLEGDFVRLEPLERRHAEPLFAVGCDPEIWRYMLVPAWVTLADAVRWCEDALRSQAAGGEVVWVTVRRTDGRVVGSTRYLDIRRPHRALEIGSTWIAPEAQRSAVNTEAKLLQLRHAFGELGAVRVQLKTDRRNEASRRAIARLGAVEEGTLRCYQTRCDGYVRDTVMFSLTAGEWPAAEARLAARLVR